MRSPAASKSWLTAARAGAQESSTSGRTLLSALGPTRSERNSWSRLPRPPSASRRGPRAATRLGSRARYGRDEGGLPFGMRLPTGASDQFQTSEEVGALEAPVLLGIRAMHRVFRDVGPVLLAYGA